MKNVTFSKEAVLAFFTLLFLAGTGFVYGHTSIITSAGSCNHTLSGNDVAQAFLLATTGLWSGERVAEVVGDALKTSGGTQASDSFVLPSGVLLADIFERAAFDNTATQI